VPGVEFDIFEAPSKPELAAKYAQMAIDIAPKTFAPYEALCKFIANGQTAQRQV
jgi:hypothetical protein